MTRKEQILALVAEGKTNQEIATQLGISPHTVRFHREPSKQRKTLRQMVKFLYDRAVREDQEKEVPADLVRAAEAFTQAKAAGSVFKATGADGKEITHPAGEVLVYLGDGHMAYLTQEDYAARFGKDPK